MSEGKDLYINTYSFLSPPKCFSMTTSKAQNLKIWKGDQLKQTYRSLKIHLNITYILILPQVISECCDDTYHFRGHFPPSLAV